MTHWFAAAATALLKTMHVQYKNQHAISKEILIKELGPEVTFVAC